MAFMFIGGPNASAACGKVFNKSWNLSVGGVAWEINVGKAQSKLIAGLSEIGDDASTIRA